jgi:hypothetical protein
VSKRTRPKNAAIARRRRRGIQRRQWREFFRWTVEMAPTACTGAIEYFTALAAGIECVPPDEVSKEMRRRAKEEWYRRARPAFGRSARGATSWKGFMDVAWWWTREACRLGALRAIGEEIAEKLLDRIFGPSLFPRMLHVEDTGARSGLGTAAVLREADDIRRSRR